MPGVACIQVCDPQVGAVLTLVTTGTTGLLRPAPTGLQEETWGPLRLMSGRPAATTPGPFPQLLPCSIQLFPDQVTKER